MLRRGTQEHTTPRASPLRLLMVVVVMAVTVVSINWGVGRFLDRRGTNLGYVYIAHKWHVLGKLDTPVDWLVLGDSSVSQGFDPAVLEAKTGQTAVNLGTIGNFGLSDDLWMLEEYIERFGPPKRVLLVHVYDVWHRKLKRNLLGRIPRPWVLSDESAELYEFSAEQRRDIFLNRYVRLYAERTSLRKSIEYTWLRLTYDDDELADFRRKDRSLPKEDPELMDDGFVRMCGANKRVLKRDSRGHMKMLRRARPRLSKDNQQAMLAIAALAREHGFKVDIINGPLYERLKMKKEWQRYFKGVQTKLQRLLADYPEVHIEPMVMGFPSKQLQNVDHITCDATEEFTEWVIERVQATGSAP